MSKQLDFNETLEQKDCGKFIILMQSYTEYDSEKDSETFIYNVSIEYGESMNYSYTLDLFESYSLTETKKYFDTITEYIEKVKGVK